MKTIIVKDGKSFVIETKTNKELKDFLEKTKLVKADEKQPKDGDVFLKRNKKL